jgi:hypothetical protein
VGFGIHGALRSLYYQKFLRPKIVLAEELDLHLVWAQSRIFNKPLPDFLVNYESWQAHISGKPHLHRVARGLIYSYCGLIPYDHDLEVAKEYRLINPCITYRAWTEFARTILLVLDPGDHTTMDERFRYGELCNLSKSDSSLFLIII